MKTRIGILIFVFLAGMILGAFEPALLYGGQTGGGNIWDQFVYTKPYKGTPLAGPLTIYYEYLNGTCPSDSSDFVANMFLVVKLIKENDPVYPNPYLFQGSSQASYLNGICMKDIAGQGAVIMDFLGNVAIPFFFPSGVTDWALTAINNGQYNDQTTPLSRAFVGDIVITVKPKK